MRGPRPWRPAAFRGHATPQNASDTGVRAAGPVEGPSPTLTFDLLESKFHPPVARPGVVARTALVERLATAHESNSPRSIRSQEARHRLLPQNSDFCHYLLPTYRFEK